MCFAILSQQMYNVSSTVKCLQLLMNFELCVVLNFLSCVNLWTPEGTHTLSVFIPVFIDNMTVISFTHRHLGKKGLSCDLGDDNMCLRERLIDNS